MDWFLYGIGLRHENEAFSENTLWLLAINYFRK